mmetsp:Transcript_40367/g.63031  ORF Transcript_40367/g.63031 Transcript_40367/m.63031 type:complete len:99 (+) Transcript_40367:768-1064(+)
MRPCSSDPELKLGTSCGCFASRWPIMAYRCQSITPDHRLLRAHGIIMAILSLLVCPSGKKYLSWFGVETCSIFVTLLNSATDSKKFLFQKSSALTMTM